MVTEKMLGSRYTKARTTVARSAPARDQDLHELRDLVQQQDEREQQQAQAGGREISRTTYRSRRVGRSRREASSPMSIVALRAPGSAPLKHARAAVQRRSRSSGTCTSRPTATRWTARSCCPGSACTRIKDYLGMVRVLEETPAVHATFNLVPSLLDQVEAYAAGRCPGGPPAALGQQARGGSSTRARSAASRCASSSRPTDRLIDSLPRFARAAGTPRPRRGRRCARRPPPRTTSATCRCSPRWPGSTWSGSATIRWCARSSPRAAGSTRRTSAAWPSASASCCCRGGARVPARRPPAARSSSAPRPTTTRSCPLLCDTEAHHEAHPGAPLPRRFRHPEDALDQIERARAGARGAVRPAARGPVAVRGLGLGGGPGGDGARRRALDRLRRRRARAQLGTPLRAGRGRRHPSARPRSTAPGYAGRRPATSPCSSATACSPTSSASSTPTRTPRPPPPTCWPRLRRVGEAWDRRGPARRARGPAHPGRRERLGALPRRRTRVPAPALPRPGRGPGACGRSP